MLFAFDNITILSAKTANNFIVFVISSSFCWPFYCSEPMPHAGTPAITVTAENFRMQSPSCRQCTHAM